VEIYNDFHEIVGGYGHLHPPISDFFGGDPPLPEKAAVAQFITGQSCRLRRITIRSDYDHRSVTAI